MLKFNINEYMYIKITDAGWKHLKETVGENYINNCIKRPEYEKEIAGEKWYRLQCWNCFDLMPPYFGGKALFESNVMFDEKDLK
jgi:hypothetical protein